MNYISIISAIFMVLIIRTSIFIYHILAAYKQSPISAIYSITRITMHAILRPRNYGSISCAGKNDSGQYSTQSNIMKDRKSIDNRKRITIAQLIRLYYGRFRERQWNFWNIFFMKWIFTSNEKRWSNPSQY